ncbi:MAG TPA: hypothetical protein VF618_06240 [Thermoanaerobaculia bacterium]
MTNHLAFLTLFLGLVAGPQPLKLQVSPSVKMVEILLDGQQVMVLGQAPWQTVVDFGPELRPRRLTAIAYDAKGNELAREAQLVNLARARAELAIVLSREKNATVAKLQWQHFSAAREESVRLTLDGKALKVDPATRSVTLPKLDLKAMHVLSAEVKFADGVLAQRELVFGGEYADSIPAELTAVALTTDEEKAAANCLTLDGEPVRVAAVERTRGFVGFVRDDTPRVYAARLVGTGRGPSVTSRMPNIYTLPGLAVRIFSPTATEVSTSTSTTSSIFDGSGVMDGNLMDTLTLLTKLTAAESDRPVRRADAVAAAAVAALRGGNRRAVVLVLGDAAPDASRHDPASVRRYLQTIGVPLIVWSVGATPELEAAWGPVEDISSPPALHRATERLRKTLDRQRIAWVEADPIAALRLTAKPDCAYMPVARVPDDRNAVLQER